MAESAKDRFSVIRRRLEPIRVRTTVAAAVVVGVALLIASIAMLTLLERSLRDGVRTTALSRAQAIADDLASSSRSSRIAVEDEEDEFAQVLNADGNVIMSSANLAGGPVVVRLEPDETRVIDDVPFEDGPFLAASAAAPTNAGRVTVVVGLSLEEVAEAGHALAGLLAFAVPLLLVVVALVTWRVVGGALAPVDAIRAKVDTISSADLHRRVPIPPGDDEISRLARTMNGMLARLEEARIRERRFVSDASHELRSPVAVIRQYAEVALRHPDGTGVTDLAQVVLEEDVRLQALVEDLLLLTRVDEGSLELRLSTVDLDDLVFEEAARLRGTTELRIDTTGVSAGRVTGDREKLERLLRNLADNAVRHAATRIELSVQQHDGRVVLRVDDDGPGVRPEHRTLVFERFARPDDSRARAHGGSGLGLAIVAEIAAAHGGSASVSDATAGGARFEVVLPAADD